MNINSEATNILRYNYDGRYEICIKLLLNLIIEQDKMIKKLEEEIKK